MKDEINEESNDKKWRLKATRSESFGFLANLQIHVFFKKKKNRKMNNQKEEKNNGVSCFLEVKCFNQELLSVFF